jgi:hypothetical protein
MVGRLVHRCGERRVHLPRITHARAAVDPAAEDSATGGPGEERR